MKVHNRRGLDFKLLLDSSVLCFMFVRTPKTIRFCGNIIWDDKPGPVHSYIVRSFKINYKSQMHSYPKRGHYAISLCRQTHENYLILKCKIRSINPNLLHLNNNLGMQTHGPRSTKQAWLNYCKNHNFIK